MNLKLHKQNNSVTSHLSLVKSSFLKGTPLKKQQKGKLNLGKSIDAIESETKKPILTSCKSIDLQVPQITGIFLKENITIFFFHLLMKMFFYHKRSFLI